MVETFNGLLAARGIDARDVSLLRHHTNKGMPGRTPYTLWRNDLSAFERYQSSQRAGKPVFRDAAYWAAFVSPAPGETLFIGLYEVEWLEGVSATWLDPLTGKSVGEGKAYPHDLFRSHRSPLMEEYIGRLKVTWPRDSIRSWVRHARNLDLLLEGPVLPAVPPKLGSEEGARVWTEQRKIERDRALRPDAIAINVARFGSPTCEACGFTNDDQALFDAHHPVPLRTGLRLTRAEELEILCPTCHRKAHRNSQLVPFTLVELRQWAADGRID